MEASHGKVKTEALLKTLPYLLSETEIEWDLGGSGPDFEALCELLKMNAIPTIELNLFREKEEAGKKKEQRKKQ